MITTHIICTTAMDDDDGLCLNIVATPTPLVGAKQSQKKPKRKGKWRRNPEKRVHGTPSIRNVETKEGVEVSPVDKQAVDSSTIKEESKSKESTIAGEKPASAVLAIKPNTTSEEPEDSDRTSNIKNAGDMNHSIQAKARTGDKNKNKKRPRTSKHDLGSDSTLLKRRKARTVPTNEPAANQEAQNSSNIPSHKTSLEDTQERANYLARYHAHPKELDRRSQTVRKVPDAKASNHLFSGKADWKSLDVSDFYIQRLKRQNLIAPTTIQAKTLLLPNLKNVLIHSETGSGKTLSYLLPILRSLPRHLSRSELSLSCLIVVPTRELAYQIYDTVNALAAGTNLIPGITVGAEKRSSEKAKLRKGLPILIGTPGRIMDHVESTKNFDLQKIQTIVLDEVDRLLLDRPEVIRHLLSGATNRQSLILVSATCDATVEKFTTDMKVEWQHVRETSIVPQQLQMLQLTVHAKYRFPALMALLGTHEAGDTVVFCSTCASVDFYHALFEKNDLSLLSNFESMKLHGSMDLADRAQSLVKFRSINSATRKVLWTTDVAARGLNLSSSSIRILQYDPPTELSDYLHRAGRTARAGNSGTCLIFTLPTESEPFAKLLRDTTDNANILLPISLNEILEVASDFFKDISKIRKADAVCLEISKHFELILYQSKDLLELAKIAFLAHIRAYAVKEKALKSVFVARGLHLGHVARSFMLKEPPTSFSTANVQKKTPKAQGSMQRKKSQLLYKNASRLEGMDSL